MKKNIVRLFCNCDSFSTALWHKVEEQPTDDIWNNGQYQTGIFAIILINTAIRITRTYYYTL
jgi:hypothetical protein